jgi:hypothetical protein
MIGHGTISAKLSHTLVSRLARIEYKRIISREVANAHAPGTDNEFGGNESGLEALHARFAVPISDKAATDVSFMRTGRFNRFHSFHGGNCAVGNVVCGQCCNRGQ